MVKCGQRVISTVIMSHGIKKTPDHTTSMLVYGSSFYVYFDSMISLRLARSGMDASSTGTRMFQVRALRCPMEFT